MLAVGADEVAIEGPALPGLPEDLAGAAHLAGRAVLEDEQIQFVRRIVLGGREARLGALQLAAQRFLVGGQVGEAAARQFRHFIDALEIARLCRPRSEEHTSELQSLMRISYAVFCLKKKKK